MEIMQIIKVSKDMQMSSKFGIMNYFVGNVLNFESFQINLIHFQENNKQ